MMENMKVLYETSCSDEHVCGSILLVGKKKKHNEKVESRSSHMKKFLIAKELITFLLRCSILRQIENNKQVVGKVSCKY